MTGSKSRSTPILGLPLAVVLASLCMARGADDKSPGRVRTRRDILALAPDGPEIAAFRRAVHVMKSRPASAATSWDFQVNIHATHDLSRPDVWNQCQHGNHFFLPWHRMYLYWMERILRDASGDPDFALPYWNYGSPASRALPEPLRIPADASNPLFVAERNRDAGGINNGARLPATAAATWWAPFRLTNFSTPDPIGFAFGGRVVDRPVHLMPTMGSFESYHNAMHVLIGGEGGFMSDPTTSARDPIFLLHHANVDRMWRRWLDQGGGRANPLDDETWMGTAFTFFDERGRRVEMAVRDALEPEGMGYRYDDDPPPRPQPRPGPPATSGPLRPLASSHGPRIDLGTDGPVSVSIELTEEARAAAARVEGSLALLIEGIRFEREPMVFYEVYINLPPGEAADPQGVHYAGNLIFAGLAPSGLHGHGTRHGAAHGGREPGTFDPTTTRALDLTDVIPRLRTRERWSDDRLTVTFVLSGLIPVANEPVTPPGVKGSLIRVGLAGD